MNVISVQEFDRDEFNAALERAAVKASADLLTELKSILEQRGKIGEMLNDLLKDHRLDRSELSAYYGNELPPYWKGKLLEAIQSMRPVITGNTVSLVIGVSYASSIERSKPKGTASGPEFEEWATDRHLKGLKTANVHQREHPFIRPAIKALFEQGGNAVFSAALAHHLANELQGL